MDIRLLGAFCIVGSLVAVADGVRQIAMGTTHKGTFLDPDAISSLSSMISWYVGILCGFLGLIVLRATGGNPIFRLLSCLPIVGLAGTIVGGLLGLTGVPIRENLPTRWAS